ncbi:carbohydrate ABC transporter substrate-binding protein (CUT1 family) [Anaerobacterium chartisolvens]|uniref:Carbohydrate ABC transporter substrate-binding protein (CUT1 family) n=1 Tax=Anaerobacterium chartisolvens TaxID=1297424 RepID=A0A369AZR0_9FIRM|nr:extracellular solute-binding protein [Anaerobacterium chartisolvens]RCX14769.1 carbohydrate ABC transporter substrate-binding protein (CUT1 family) [Anaerobacterium chartisolvens]
MIKLTKVMAVVTALAMATSLAACGGGADKPVDPAKTNETTAEVKNEEKVKIKFLSLSADDNRNAIRDNYIKVNVEKDMPNVEVEYDLGGGGQDYANKLKAYNASGDMPDVWFSEQNLSSVVIAAGNALDLLPQVQKSGFDKKMKLPDLVAPDKNGKLFCVQPGADQYFTPRIWYHKDIFAQNNIEVPKTFDELVKVCETLKGKGLIPMSIFGKDGWVPNLAMVQTMIMAEDPQVAQDLVNNKTDFSNPVVKNALGRIQKLVQIGAFDKGVTNVDYGPSIEAYTSGKAAMLVMFTWETAALEKAAPDTDFFPWPSAKEGLDPNDAIQYWGAPLSGYLASAKAKNPEVAADFAIFCATQDALYYNDNGSPTMLDTGKQVEITSPLLKKSLDQFDAAKIKVPSMWAATFNAKMSAEFATQNSKLLTGKYSPDEWIKAINPVWAENFE